MVDSDDGDASEVDVVSIYSVFTLNHEAIEVAEEIFKPPDEQGAPLLVQTCFVVICIFYEGI